MRCRMKIAIPAVLAIFAAGYIAAIALDLLSEPVRAGDPTAVAKPAGLVEAREQAQRKTALARDVAAPKQILFGDLHVHTMFSGDTFIRALPMMNGEGAYPAADACDFARYCSSLDFWSINDHAEGLSPRVWRETKEFVRQCNDVAGDAANPDMVTLLGWEWTQTNLVKEKHFGHKNVIFLDTDEDKVPARPISSMMLSPTGERRNIADFMPMWERIRNPMFDFSNRQLYYDLIGMFSEFSEVPFCADDVDVRELPVACSETAPTPRELFTKLDQWGFDSIVIPHGNAWGVSVPPGSTWTHQLYNGNHDPDRQLMIEIYSGHGNSEEYRDWRSVWFDADGQPHCPEPSADYTPSCWMAGEIIRGRCAAARLDDGECDSRAEEARRNYVRLGNLGFHTVPGQTPQDWLDAGQCRDCFLPAFNLRPGYSTQYALATGGFEDEGKPARLRFGIIGSSDTHRGRPGVGYKEFDRHGMTDAHGAASEAWARRLEDAPLPPEPRSKVRKIRFSMLNFGEMERRSPYLTTGGLAAVHASGRNREAVWAGLKQKEVYGTSGPRVLLWFDLLNGADGELPMGAETEMRETPKFRVRAAGSFKQKPGCPEFTMSALTPARLDRLCHDECYNPSDERHLITRIEVVRIKPRLAADEPIGPLIETPWRTFQCPPDPNGCTMDFEDEEFAAAGRDTAYYVRAIQEPTPKISGENLRCEYDDQGNCVKTNICVGSYRTPKDDDCLGPAEERAWSSPIFVDYPRS